MRQRLVASAIALAVLAACGSHATTTSRAGSGTAPTEISRPGGPTETSINTTTTLVATTTSPVRSTSPRPGLPPSGSATGVHGAVTAGPTCPVEQAGHPCPPNPVNGDVTASDANGNRAGVTHTASDGSYSLALSPGRYTLTVSTGSRYPRCPPTDVTVVAGTMTRTDISCDTGIR